MMKGIVCSTSRCLAFESIRETLNEVGLVLKINQQSIINQSFCSVFPGPYGTPAADAYELLGPAAACSPFFPCSASPYHPVFQAVLLPCELRATSNLRQ